MTAFFILLLIAAGVFGYRKWSRKQAPKNLLATALSDHQRAIVAKQVPLTNKLPLEFREKLEGKINVFLAQVEFIGCNGLDVNEEMELSIAMHLGDNGELNLKIRPDNDFDLVIWKRGEVGGADSSGASGDAIGYLDSLKTCEPGEFEFSYPGFGTYHNTIVGRSSDGCQVHIEHPQIRMTCNYSEAMVALLTSKEKYEDARNGVLQGSTDSEESRLMSEECSVD